MSYKRTRKESQNASNDNASDSSSHSSFETQDDTMRNALSDNTEICFGTVRNFRLCIA